MNMRDEHSPGRERPEGSPGPDFGVAGSADPGRDESVDALFRANLPWLRGWLGARLHGHARQDVDDLCQDILLKAFRGLGRLRDRDRFPAWLYRIANNRLRDYLRQKSRSGRDGQEEVMEIEDPSPPGDELEQREEIRRLLGAVLDLPARYREPMILRHVRDLSYAEIGQVLGITENNAQVRIFRARKMLRESIEGCDGIEEGDGPSGRRSGRDGLALLGVLYST